MSESEAVNPDEYITKSPVKAGGLSSPKKKLHTWKQAGGGGDGGMPHSIPSIDGDDDNDNDNDDNHDDADSDEDEIIEVLEEEFVEYEDDDDFSGSEEGEEVVEEEEVVVEEEEVVEEEQDESASAEEGISKKGESSDGSQEDRPVKQEADATISSTSSPADESDRRYDDKKTSNSSTNNNYYHNDDDDEVKEYKWEKPEWTKNKTLRATGKSDKLKEGKLEAPITSLPHLKEQGADHLAFEKPHWVDPNAREMKDTGKSEKLKQGDSLSATITDAPHKGDIQWEKPDWTKKSPLRSTPKGSVLKEGKDLARAIGGIKPVDM